MASFGAEGEGHLPYPTFIWADQIFVLLVRQGWNNRPGTRALNRKSLEFLRCIMDLKKLEVDILCFYLTHMQHIAMTCIYDTIELLQSVLSYKSVELSDFFTAT